MSRSGLLQPRSVALLVAAGIVASGCARTPQRTAPVSAPSEPLSLADPARSAPSVIERSELAGGIDYVLRASRLANLTWQLDCITGLIRCSRPAYEPLWRDTLRSDPRLKNALEGWVGLRRKVRGPVGDAPTSRSLLPLPRSNADLSQRVRLAGVVAADADHYESLLYALTDRGTARRLRETVETFQPSFEPLWQQAAPELEQAISEQAAIHARQDVARTIQRVSEFYGAELGTRPRMAFNLLFRPIDDSPTHATQVLDRGLIEVVKTEPPELRVQVPVHEMFHYLFSAAPTEQLDQLAQRFATSPNPDALSAYGLLDEVLATGLSQGVLARKLSPQELESKLAGSKQLYADEYITETQRDRTSVFPVSLCEKRNRDELGLRPQLR